MDSIKVKTLAALRSLDSNTLNDGDLITLTGDHIAGHGVVFTSDSNIKQVKGIIEPFDNQPVEPFPKKGWKRIIEGNSINPAWSEIIGDGYTIQSKVDTENLIFHAMAVNKIIEFEAGEFIYDDTINLGDIADIRGGVKLAGASPNSQGVRTVFIQADINKPIFQDSSINTHISTMAFTCWAGNSKTASGDIIAVAHTSDSITLSSDPWVGKDPVIWIDANQNATDGTLYQNAIRFNCQGAWLARSATRNQDGTLTLNDVKGTALTVNESLSGVDHHPVTFISLAHTSDPANFTDANTAIIRRNVRENQYFRDLWFHQVTRCFSYDQFGSGSGHNAGIGNSGFMLGIVADQAMNIIFSMGDIFGLQMDQSQAYGIARSAFECYGNFSSNQVDLKCELCTGLLEVSQDTYGNVMTGSYNESINNSYCDQAVVVHGMSSYDSYSVNWGRAQKPVFEFKQDVVGLSFHGNNIRSHSEAGNDGFFHILGSFEKCNLSGNNFVSQFGSGALIVKFGTTSVSVNDTVWGDNVIHKTNHDLVGWVDADLTNSWLHAEAGDAKVGYFKDDKGEVYLRGSAKNDQSGSGTPIFTLPASFRPPFNQHILGLNSGLASKISITQEGLVTHGVGTSSAHFDGISFSTVYE